MKGTADIMDDDNVEHFAGQLREMLEKFGLPYLKISIRDIDTSYTDSEITDSEITDSEITDSEITDSKTPLRVLSSKIERLVNALLWDTMGTRAPEAGFLLTQLEDQVDSLISLSDYLRVLRDKIVTGKKGDQQPPPMPDSKSVGKKVPKPEPIPKIFSDTLKDILTDLDEQSAAKKKPSKTRKTDKPAPKKAAKAKKTNKPSAKKEENEDK